MAVDLNLKDIQTGFLSLSTFNSNNTLIEEALAKTLNRTSNASSNAMEVDLDMGLNSIFNVATNTAEPTSLLTVADADARYVNTDGDTLVGDLNAGGFNITNLGIPSAPNDAARLVDVGPDSSAQLRIDLADNSTNAGSDLVAYAGSNKTVTDAINERTVYVSDYTALKARTGVETTIVDSTDKAGIFTWRSGDQSVHITADPQEGVWVAPNSDTTGASGAWMRLYNGIGLDSGVNAAWFGLSESATAVDNSTALNAAISYSSAKTVKIPNGTFSYSSLNNIKQSGLSIIGSGSAETILSYTGTDTAISTDAFIDASPSDPFVNNLKIEGISIVGTTMTTGWYARGIARSSFKDIRINGSNGVDGTTAYEFEACSLNLFENIYSSYVDGDLPYRGLSLKRGKRAGNDVGACSNNTFKNCYFEGNPIGIQLFTDTGSSGADQNFFIGGSAESCTVYGMVVTSACRYNTFIGVGFENLNVLNNDVNDSGIYNKYINCYSSDSIVFGSTSKGCSIEGGYFERVEAASGAEGSTFSNITVNNWATGSGGFFNNGTGTKYRSIYDIDAGVYLYPSKARSSITVGTSPFLYQNNDLVPLQIRVDGGTVTEVLQYRGADLWTMPKPSASSSGNTGIYIVMPGDSLRVAYSSAPQISKLPLNDL